MIATWFLIAFMLVATVTDVWHQKIYNWTTYSGIMVALALSGIASLLDRSNIASIGIGESFVGFLVCGIVMLICMVLFQGIGGGDVKLLAMAGSFLGPELGIEVLLWTFVIGGAVGIIILVWKLGAINLGRRVWQQMMFRLSLGEWGPLTDEEKQQLKMPLYIAPNILIAVFIVRFSIVEHIVR